MGHALIIGTALLALTASVDAPRADDVNRTGQSQKTPGVDSSVPSNPAQGDRPSYPGDQPAKEGTEPSSQVHNLNQSDLAGKKKDPQ
jgi:hypothetical protein